MPQVCSGQTRVLCEESSPKEVPEASWEHPQVAWKGFSSLIMKNLCAAIQRLVSKQIIFHLGTKGAQGWGLRP